MRPPEHGEVDPSQPRWAELRTDVVAEYAFWPDGRDQRRGRKNAVRRPMDRQLDNPQLQPLLELVGHPDGPLALLRFWRFVTALVPGPLDLDPSSPMLPHHSAKTSDSRMPANITKSKHSRSRSSSRCHAAAYCSRPTVNFSADSLASFTGAFRP